MAEVHHSLLRKVPEEHPKGSKKIHLEVPLILKKEDTMTHRQGTLPLLQDDKECSVFDDLGLLAELYRCSTPRCELRLQHQRQTISANTGKNKIAVSMIPFLYCLEEPTSVLPVSIASDA